MNNTEVLILHGSPGSGKSTIADAVSELLREADTPHAIIDLDEISRIFPTQDPSFSKKNLKAIWPNYAAVQGLRGIIPTVIVDKEELRLLRDALPEAKFMICELMAPEEVLKERVMAREPNEFWQKTLLKWLDVYRNRSEDQKFGDFEVDTHDKSVEEAAREVVAKAGWEKKD